MGGAPRTLWLPGFARSVYVQKDPNPPLVPVAPRWTGRPDRPPLWRRDIPWCPALLRGVPIPKRPRPDRGTRVSPPSCGEAGNVTAPLRPRVALVTPKAQAELGHWGVSLGGSWGPAPEITRVGDHRIYLCPAATWSVGVGDLQRGGRCVAPPVECLTCCTPHPNVLASYICTTNVAKEVTNPCHTGPEHYWSTGPLARFPLMGGAPSHIGAPLRV